MKSRHQVILNKLAEGRDVKLGKLQEKLEEVSIFKDEFVGNISDSAQKIGIALDELRSTTYLQEEARSLYDSLIDLIDEMEQLGADIPMELEMALQDIDLLQQVDIESAVRLIEEGNSTFDESYLI